MTTPPVTEFDHPNQDPATYVSGTKEYVKAWFRSDEEIDGTPELRILGTSYVPADWITADVIVGGLHYRKAKTTSIVDFAAAVSGALTIYGRVTDSPGPEVPIMRSQIWIIT